MMTSTFNDCLSPYHLRQTHNRVEAWSIKRLPFEPTHWLKNFRQELRTAARQLRSDSDQLLHAIYASPVRELCDTENVLLYNVGLSHFAEAARYGLRFERAFQIIVACPHPLTTQPLHYHDYCIAPSGSPFQHWNKGGTLASWNFTSNAKAIKQCALVWYAMKTGKITTSNIHHTVPPRQYGLQLQLDVPYRDRVRLPEIVKPLFDGIISALHYHDGTDQAELSRRVATLIGAGANDISALLQEKTATVLGRRKLLHRFRDNVQWNPQDDSCFVGQLHLNETGRSDWVVHGELFEVNLK